MPKDEIPEEITIEFECIDNNGKCEGKYGHCPIHCNGKNHGMVIIPKAQLHALGYYKVDDVNEKTIRIKYQDIVYAICQLFDEHQNPCTIDVVVDKVKQLQIKPKTPASDSNCPDHPNGHIFVKCDEWDATCTCGAIEPK